MDYEQANIKITNTLGTEAFFAAVKSVVQHNMRNEGQHCLRKQEVKVLGESINIAFGDCGLNGPWLLIETFDQSAHYERLPIAEQKQRSTSVLSTE